MRRLRSHSGSAAVEVVLLAPVLLALLALIVGAGRVVVIRSAVESVVRESARSATQASNAEHALSIVESRSDEVAAEMGLDPARMVVRADLDDFSRGAPMVVSATYRVQLNDLPAFGLIPGSFVLSARHVETVERHKSR